MLSLLQHLENHQQLEDGATTPREAARRYPPPPPPPDHAAAGLSGGGGGGKRRVISNIHRHCYSLDCLSLLLQIYLSSRDKTATATPTSRHRLSKPQWLRIAGTSSPSDGASCWHGITTLHSVRFDAATIF
jgi:hypothetical protein